MSLYMTTDFEPQNDLSMDFQAQDVAQIAAWGVTEALIVGRRYR